MKTLVLVAAREYDEAVIGVVEGDEKEAEILAARVQATDPNTDYRIEALPTIPLDVRRVEVLTLAAEILDDGTNEEHRPSFHVAWPWETSVDTTRMRWVRPPAYSGRGGRLTVIGVDHDEVRSMYRHEKRRLLHDANARLTEHERNPA